MMSVRGHDEEFLLGNFNFTRLRCLAVGWGGMGGEHMPGPTSRLYRLRGKSDDTRETTKLILASGFSLMIALTIILGIGAIRVSNNLIGLSSFTVTP